MLAMPLRCQPACACALHGHMERHVHVHVWRKDQCSNNPTLPPSGRRRRRAAARRWPADHLRSAKALQSTSSLLLAWPHARPASPQALANARGNSSDTIVSCNPSAHGGPGRLDVEQATEAIPTKELLNLLQPAIKRSARLVQAATACSGCCCAANGNTRLASLFWPLPLPLPRAPSLLVARPPGVCSPVKYGWCHAAAAA